jgi:serine/threonine protein kinase
MDMNALIGRDVAGFRLTHRLGEGGMAMVFRGENVLDPSIVRAIKIVHPHLSAQPEFVKRITLEARILDQLHHPNIVRFYGLRQASVDHTSLLIMELEMLEGQPLSSLVRPNLPVAQAVEWIRQASEGVAAAHALGIVHRDLKPDNLLVTKSGQIKVLDFGIAKAFDDTRRVTQVTMAGVIPGTPGYMAPEVCNGAVPTAAADVYALGVTLYELLLGRHPFTEPGQAPLSGLQMMFAHTQRDMPQVSTYRADVPKNVESAIISATIRDISRRYPAGLNFAQALIGLNYPSTPLATPNPSPAVSWTSFQLPSQGITTATPSAANANGPPSANAVAPAFLTPAGSSTSAPPQTAFLLPSPSHGLSPGYAPPNAPTAMVPGDPQSRPAGKVSPVLVVILPILVLILFFVVIAHWDDF